MAITEMKPSTIKIRSDEFFFAQEAICSDVRTLSNEDFGQIESAFNNSGVIYIRGQTLDPEDLIAFSKRFGAIESHPRQEYALEGYPQIHVLSNIKDGERTIGSAYAGDEWHTDLCFMNSPSRMSILYSIEIPFNDDGKVLGDTLFVSAADAYDDLDSKMKDFIADKRGIMQYNRRQEIKRLERLNDHPRPPLSEEVKALTPDITQPIVRTHPITGRKSIYVNQVYTFGIEGIEENESAPILKKLCGHITK